jgi:hypothetical protein
VIDDTLTWDNHIDQLISRLNSACYVIRSVKEIMSMNALRMLNFCYIHFVIVYGIMFWGSAPNSINIFRIKEKCNQLEECGFM